MNILREIFKIGKRYQIDEESSKGLFLSFYTAMDDFLQNPTSKKIVFFKKERLSRNERNFLREVLHQIFYSKVVREERQSSEGNLLTESQTNPKLPKEFFKPGIFFKNIWKELIK